MYKILVVLLFVINLFANDTIETIKKFEPTQEEIQNGAVILKRTISTTLNSNNYATEKIYYLIAILDEQAAKDYSHLRTSFNSHFKKYNLDFAQVISKSGEISPLKKDAMILKASSNNYYSDNKTLEFSLPNLKAGMFIEYQLTSNTIKQLIPNQYFEDASFVKYHVNKGSKLRIDSIKESTIQITVPNQQKLYYSIYNIKDKLAIKKDTTHTSYSATYKNLPSISLEPFSIKSYSEIIPSFYVATTSDWKLLTQYLYKKFDEKTIVTPKLKALALDIIKEKQTKQEKIIAIYNYIQKNIKYIFANLGSGGYIPHSANEILENLYGDCKDQTILFITLLKAVGIESYPTLIHSNERMSLSEKSIVSPYYFNHMIAYIPSENQWVDNTGDYYQYPGISYRLLGQSSLILKNDSFEFKKVSDQLNNKLYITQNYKLKDENVFLTLDINLLGTFSHYYKSYYATNNKSFKINFKSFISQMFKNAEIVNLQFFNVNSPKENFKIQVIIKQSTKIDVQTKTKPIITYGSSSIDGLISQFTNLSYFIKNDNNKFGFNFGFEYEVIKTANCQAPTVDSKPTLVQLPKALQTKYFETTFKHHENSDNSISVMTTFKVKQAKLMPKDYNKELKEFKTAINNSIWLLQYQYNQFYADEKKLKSNSDLDSQIKLAQSYMNQMELDKAQSILENLIDQYPEHYKLNYTYGVVLGLNGNDQLSEKYLATANKIKLKKDN